MKVLRQSWRRTRVRLARMPRRTRILAAVLAGVVLAGAAWLALGSGREQWVRAGSVRLESDDLAAARTVLADEGVPTRVESGRLMVPRESAERAKAILARVDVLGSDALSSIEKLAGENDIWRTQSQNDKRWQAAKMAALGKLISGFPAIRSATVLFEPGSPRRLGSAGVATTAAVTVRLQAGQAMTEDLLAAIGDLVAGSIAGMTRPNIHIVDADGRSYRLGEESGAGGVEDRRLAEAYYRRKLHTALNYIPQLVVSVRMEGKDRERVPHVSICVPRSYLAAVHRSTNGGAGDLPADQTDSFAKPHLARVRGAAVAAIGAPDADAVTVDWYYDVQPDTPAGTIAPLADRTQWVAENALVLAGGALVGVVALVAIFLPSAVRRRRIKRRRARLTAPSSHDEQQQCGLRDEAPETFAFLEQVADEDLLGLIRGEHPQAIALILSNLPPARAARILANIPQGGQVEVTRRIAALNEIDPDVAAEVERGLAERVSNAVASASAGGVSAVAEILRHADYATEQSVLEGLSGSEPILAGSLRRRMFVFEDIALMPAKLLGEALEDIESTSLAVALRTAGDELRRKVLSSLSPGAEAGVREEMDRIGPVRLSDVESAQMRIAEAVRRIDEGQYIAGGRRENEVLA